MSTAKLIFLMPPEGALNVNPNNLKWGKLIIDDGVHKVSFMATSGLGGYQHLAHSRIKRKGRLPSCEQACIPNYQLDLSPINLPNVKGVNGLFYRILPFEVMSQGFKRSDLGIHFDANIPGSSGCIVLKQPDHWELFKQIMNRLKLEENKLLPLFVY
jgi:hypothetical protein